MHKLSLIIPIVAVFIISCNSSSNKDPLYMAFDDVIYVNKFPLTFQLDNPVVPEVSIIGMKSFKIIDSLLILGKNGEGGLLDIYKLPEYKAYGNYLKVGKGPLELSAGTSLSLKNAFRVENNDLIAYLYNFQRGNILRFNISKTINFKELDLIDYDNSLPPFLPAFCLLDDSTYFYKEISNKDTQQIRYVSEKGKIYSTPTMDILNKAYIEEGEDFNILAAMTLYSEKNNKIIEMPIGLNYLNVYNIDGTFKKSICIGKSLMDINEVQEEKPWDRMYTFSSVSIFDNFFGVVYINQTEKDFQSKIDRPTSILFFDWDANPIAKVNFKSAFTNFNIDLISNHIYTFSHQSDEFLKYDMNEILLKFPK